MVCRRGVALEVNTRLQFAYCTLGLLADLVAGCLLSTRAPIGEMLRSTLTVSAS